MPMGSVPTGLPFTNLEDDLSPGVPEPEEAHDVRHDLDISTEEEIEKRLMDYHINVDVNDSLVIMSFKLPIRIERQANGTHMIKESNSMTYPTLFKIREETNIDFRWIGWPGIIPKNEAEKEQITNLLHKEKCYPVWFEKSELEDFLLF